MEDEMDSLFEGMVLFTPSQLSSVHPPPGEPAPHDRSQLEDLPLHSASSEPLDENLFSDLTIVSGGGNSADQIPQEDGGAQSSPSASVQAMLSLSVEARGSEVTSLGRKVSRKKKRATGLRIGYGRESVVSSGASAERAAEESPSDSVNMEAENLDASRSSGVDGPVAATSSKEENGIPMAFSSEILSDNNDLEAPRELENSDNSGASNMSSELPIKNEEIVVTEGPDDRKEPDIMELSDSTEETFENLKAQISSKLDNSRTLAASLSTAKKECVRKRRKAAEKLSLASSKYKELEKQLEEACETEDFEMAEKVSEMLGVANSERKELVDALRDVEAECDVIDVKMDEVLRSRIVAEEECISLMEDFSADATASSELIVSMAELQYAERMNRWLSSSVALEGKKIELDIESFVINEACQVLNGSIDHSVEDDSRQKEMLMKKRSLLHSELEELLALVRQKEREIAENDANIELVQQSIDSVVSGFRDSHLEIEGMKGILKSNLSKVDREGEDLATQKEDIDDFLSKEEEKGSKIRELAKLAADEAKAYRETAVLRKGLMQSILNFREIKSGLGKTEEKLSEELQTLQSRASSARASLQELSSTKSSLQQDVASFEQRIVFVDKRLPELETEKKVAASARNFKEAARIAAEAKSFSTEKESLQNQLDEATSELDRLDEKIKETIDNLQDAENEILSKEREVALAQFQRLLVIVSATKAERTAALELGDEEEANLLLVAMEAAELEAGKLRTSYDFKDEDLGVIPKAYVPIELVSNLTAKQLADLATSLDLPAATQS